MVRLLHQLHQRLIFHIKWEKSIRTWVKNRGNNTNSFDQFSSLLQHSQQEEKQQGRSNSHSSNANSYDGSFYQNFSEPIHDIPEEQRRSQDKTLISPNLTTTTIIVNLEMLNWNRIRCRNQFWHVVPLVESR